MATATRRKIRSAPIERPSIGASEVFRSQVHEIAASVADTVLQTIGDELPTTAPAFQDVEERFLEIAGRELVGPLLDALLTELHRSEEFVVWAMAMVRRGSPSPLVTSCDRTIPVRVAGGSTISVHTPYYMPKEPKQKPGPKGGRRPTGTGLYPVLAALGFVMRFSPHVMSSATKAAALADSYQEASEILRGQGLDMDGNMIRRTVERGGDAGLFDRENRVGETPTLRGKRVVVCLDGGRVRYRIDRPGRRRKSGHHGYEAPWREPKVVAIYTVDERGKKVGRSIYEGTLAPWDDAIELVGSTLRAHGVSEATQVAIAADGSSSIWDRVDRLIEIAGIERSRVVLFIDFYHAIEHLNAAAKLSAEFTDQTRQHWVRKQARRLKRGRVAQVITAMEGLSVDDPDALAREIGYFDKRRELMRYDELLASNLPIGTGAVESAIRRVVNLRLKGSGIFWTPANAERMLYLRCRLKADRWEDVDRALHRAALLPAAHARPAILERLTS
jgi:hypothetical protein